jgi:hypothetical protein
MANAKSLSSPAQFALPRGNLSPPQLDTDDAGASLPNHSTSSSTASSERFLFDPLWTPEQVARALNVSPDWVASCESPCLADKCLTVRPTLRLSCQRTREFW